MVEQLSSMVQVPGLANQGSTTKNRDHCCATLSTVYKGIARAALAVTELESDLNLGPVVNGVDRYGLVARFAP